MPVSGQFWQLSGALVGLYDYTPPAPEPARVVTSATVQPLASMSASPPPSDAPHARVPQRAVELPRVEHDPRLLQGDWQNEAISTATAVLAILSR